MALTLLGRPGDPGARVEQAVTRSAEQSTAKRRSLMETAYRFARVQRSNARLRTLCGGLVMEAAAIEAAAWGSLRSVQGSIVSASGTHCPWHLCRAIPN